MYRKNPQSDQFEMVAAELKRGYDSEPREEQEEWLEALGQYIPNTYTWRPENWDEIESVLQYGRLNKDAERPTAPPRPRSPSPIPVNFGLTIKGIIEKVVDKELPKGAAVGLRRMNPDNPNTPIFWQLMARDGMPRNPDVNKWGLIVNGIALMAHGSGVGHDRRIPVGKALHDGDGKREPWYSEDRLATLLAARGNTLHRLLARLFRMLGSAGCSFDWREMSWFILNEGHRDDVAESARVKIAREYYRRHQRRQPNPQNSEE